MLLIGCVSDLLLCQVVLKCGGGEKGGGVAKKVRREDPYLNYLYTL